MLTLQASDLIKHHEEQNKLESHHHSSDVNTDNLHGPEAMHNLQNCVDNNLNKNIKLPFYRTYNNSEEPSTFFRNRNDIYGDPEVIRVENDEDEDDEEDEEEEEEEYNDDDDDDDDDDEEDEDEQDIAESENVISQMGGWTNGMPMNKTLHETITGHVLPSLDTTNFGEINIQDSTNIRIGNTTLYKGPVTIKHFVYTPSYPNHDSSESTNNERISDSNPNDVPIVKDNSKVPIFPIQREYNKVREWLWTWRCAAILSVMALIFISTVVVVSMSFSQRSPYPPLPPALDPDDILYDGIRFIQRTEWGAQPPEDVLDELEVVPTPYVIISHTASENCSTQSECVQRVRVAQMMHIEINKWSDIAYNFLIGGDGQVYIGRGWDIMGAHSFGFNSKSIGISLIGTFNKIVPTQRQLHVLEKLIEMGVKKGKIAENYKLLGHRQVSATLSPGDVLYNIIKTWDHWAEKP